MTGGRPVRRWAARLLVAVAAGIFVGGSQQAVNGLLGGERWSWAEMAASVVLWAVLGPPVGWLVSRALERGHLPQSPSAGVRTRRSELVRPVMAAGTVPPEADPEVWRRALDDEVREWNGQRWVWGAFALVVAALIGGAAVRSNGNDWRVGSGARRGRRGRGRVPVVRSAAPYRPAARGGAGRPLLIRRGPDLGELRVRPLLELRCRSTSRTLPASLDIVGCRRTGPLTCSFGVW